MARTYARINVDIWKDPDWRTLTRGAQWMYLMILSHQRLDVAGCLIMNRRTLHLLAVDLDEHDLDERLKELDHAGMIAVDDDTGELVVRTFVTHDGVLRNQNLARGMWAAWARIESPHLQQVVIDNLPDEAWELRFMAPHEARQMRHQ